MTRYTHHVLLTLALMMSGATALCQKPDSNSKPEETKPTEAQANQPSQKVTPPRTTPTLGDTFSFGTTYKHTPDVPILRRIIDLDMRDSTLRQAAVAISKASGVAIRVDDKVPTDARLNVTAQKVPLTTVLEVIARQTEIAIEPDGQGILLRSWPVLEVNNTKQIFVGRNEPWSDAWDKLPNPNNPAFGGPAGVQPGNFNPFGGAPVIGDLPLAQPGRAVDVQRANGIAPTGVLFGGISLTALNDHSFVVAEPAFGPNGESGVMLTVYRLEGAQLKVVSSIFHKLAVVGAGGHPNPFFGGRDLNKFNPNQDAVEKGLAPNTFPTNPAGDPFTKGPAPDNTLRLPGNNKAAPSDPFTNGNAPGITVPAEKAVSAPGNNKPATGAPSGNNVSGTKPAPDGKTATPSEKKPK